MTTEQQAREPEPEASSEVRGSGFSAFPHHYYHDESRTDINVMRADAGRRLTDERKESSVIHLHAKEEPCKGNKHEVFTDE
jgi:hypothetical protein